MPWMAACCGLEKDRSYRQKIPWIGAETGLIKTEPDAGRVTGRGPVNLKP